MDCRFRTRCLGVIITSMILRPLICLLCILPAMAGANAPIYKYVDPYGNVTYSNVPVPGARRSPLPPVAINPNTAPAAVLSNRDSKQKISVRSAPALSAAGSGGIGTSPATTGSYPVIDSATQRTRDASRARILQDELDNEQRALLDTRRMLQETERHARPDSALVRGLRDTVLEREKNIAALQREIGRR